MDFTFQRGTQAVMGIPIGKLNQLDARVTKLETSSTIGAAFMTPTSGALNQSTFTWSAAPKIIYRDGVPMQKVSTDGTVNWTGATTTTLSIWPTSDIFALS